VGKGVGKTDGMRAGAHAHEGDTGLVAAKLANVAAHPVEQQPLVPQPQVQGALALGEGGAREAQRADAVVEVDADDGGAGPAHEAAHVALGAQAAVEGATVDINHNGHRGRVGLMPTAMGALGPVDIQVEAVLAVEHAGDARRRAGADGAKAAGVKGRRRRQGGQVQRDGGPEAVLAARCLRKGDAAPCLDGPGQGCSGRQDHARVAALCKVDGGRRASVRRWRARPGAEGIAALLVPLVPGHVPGTRDLGAHSLTSQPCLASRSTRAPCCRLRLRHQRPQAGRQSVSMQAGEVEGETRCCRSG
jgi:hypothetical protein